VIGGCRSRAKVGDVSVGMREPGDDRKAYLDDRAAGGWRGSRAPNYTVVRLKTDLLPASTLGYRDRQGPTGPATTRAWAWTGTSPSAPVSPRRGFLAQDADPERPDARERPGLLRRLVYKGPVMRLGETYKGLPEDKLKPEMGSAPCREQKSLTQGSWILVPTKGLICTRSRSFTTSTHKDGPRGRLQDARSASSTSACSPATAGNGRNRPPTDIEGGPPLEI